jgi:hypothetical protein
LQRLKKDYRVLLMIFFCAISSSLYGQQEFTLHFNRDAVQSSFTNPAFQSEYKVTITLPSVTYNYGNNAFAYYDIIATDPTDDSTYIDIEGILGKMGNTNILQMQSYLDLIGIYFNAKDWYFSFNVTGKIDAKLLYTKDMVNFLWNGNAQYIGQSIEIGPGINVQLYKEYGLRVGRHFEKFDVGARIKLLSGIANLYSARNSMVLSTGQTNYESTLSTDYEIREAGLEQVGLADFDPVNTEYNPGYSFDLGGVYRFNEKWEITASVIDLGRIKWNTDVTTHKSNGVVKFSGIDINDFISDGEVNFEKYQDSIGALYFTSTEGGSYINNLVPKTYLSGSFYPNKKTSFGALFQAEYFRGFQPGIGLYAGRDLSNFLQLGLSYAYKNRRFDNVGFNVNLGTPAFRFYVITDNLFNFLRMGYGKNVTFRYGLNINIEKLGMKKTKKRDKIKEESIPEIPTKEITPESNVAIKKLLQETAEEISAYYTAFLKLNGLL